MALVVDTCLLIDLAEEDPAFCRVSAQLLDRQRSDGLVLCPISYIELAPVFESDASGLQEFLGKLGVHWPEDWTAADTQAAFEAWNRYVKQKRQGSVPKQPIADILIGAYAMLFQGLLTRNGADFSKLFPALKVVEP